MKREKGSVQDPVADFDNGKGHMKWNVCGL